MHMQFTNAVSQSKPLAGAWLAPRPSAPQAAPTPASALASGLLLRALDALDHGILLIAPDGRVAHANRAAQHAQADDLPLHWSCGVLQARRAADAGVLQRALSGALSQGTQSMVRLGAEGPASLRISVLPLNDPGSGPAALVLLPKYRLCEELGTDAYAREHALTAAETRVLKLLSAGCRPRDIAVSLGVKLSTVRTQISSIRQKTGARDIGGIVYHLSLLPPLPGLMRRAA